MLLGTFKQFSHYTDEVPRYKGSQRWTLEQNQDLQKMHQPPLAKLYHQD